MIANLRSAKYALLVFTLAAAGCSETVPESGGPSGPEPAAATTPAETPAPATAEPAPATAESAVPKTGLSPTPTEKAPEPTKPQAATETAKPEAGEGPVKLQLVKFDEFQKRMANKNVKYTVVDVWATWCGPCKENFPHLVEMNRKYGGKNVAFASLSFDDPTEAKLVHDAQEFLEAKKAEFPNYMLDEEQGVGNEKLEISSIPAVFIYGSDGKVVKKFSMDDPDHQFTYEEVEKTVVALLEGKPLPAGEPAKAEAK